MATTYTPAVAPFGAITVHRAVIAISNAIASFSAWNDRRRSIDALRRLTERADQYVRPIGNRRDMGVAPGG